MIVELGHFALIIALVLALVQSILPVWGAATNQDRLMHTADSTSVGIFVFVGLAFAALMYAYAVSDFSVLNVWQNSHSKMPFIFKLSGTWGNHEGSMLLWVLILAIFAAAVSVFGSRLPMKLRANVQGVQAWMLATFIAFILITSNPFERQVAPIEGQDLNPILQDIGLAIHPPMLYLGYVGFSITFAFAIAALMEGRLDSAWARWVRPWALGAWLFLTAGISMGSYWAYYELGWGGWWFWDPVENASFLPWLSGTALLHSALVMEKREALKIWTVLLAILTFSLSLLGTFLVRSGVLTSVHSFASNPERGVFILIILTAFVGGSLLLFVVRSTKLEAGGLFAPISREGALVFNNLILSAMTATVLIGTLYPVIYEALTDAKISVGAPFFNAVFIPLMVPLVLLLPFGPLLSWKRGDMNAAMERLYFAAAMAVLAAVLIGAFFFRGPWLAPIFVGLSVWLMIGAFAELWQRMGVRKSGLKTGFSRLAGLPNTIWSTAFAHFGVGVTMLGVVLVTTYETETITVMKPGDNVAAGGYVVRHLGYQQRKGPNYTESSATMEILKDGNIAALASPSKRFFPARQQPTNEASINTFGFSQLYLALGDGNEDGSITVRIWWKPYVILIWLGSIFMVFAGCISLADRRLRIGVPQKKKDKIAVASDVQA